MGVKAGLDPRIMMDVINAGTGRNTATEFKFREHRHYAQVQPRLHQRTDDEGREARACRKRRLWACRWMWPRRWRARCSWPATRSARTETSPPSCSRSSGVPASRYARQPPPYPPPQAGEGQRGGHERRRPRGLCHSLRASRSRPRPRITSAATRMTCCSRSTISCGRSSAQARNDHRRHRFRRGDGGKRGSGRW